MAINFNDTTQPAGFEICTEDRKHTVSISAPVGEILQPYNIHEKEFIKEQGEKFLCISGMTCEIMRYSVFLCSLKDIVAVFFPRHSCLEEKSC